MRLQYDENDPEKIGKSRSEKAPEKLWIFSGHPVTNCTFTKIHKKIFCLRISQGMTISMGYKNCQKSVIFQIFLLTEGLRKR